MEFLSIVISNLIWLVYALSEGLKDGTFDFYKKSSKKYSDFNDRKLFKIQRFLVLLATSSIMIFMIGYISIIFILGQLVTFKYFYDITYNCAIRKIEKDESNKKD